MINLIVPILDNNKEKYRSLLSKIDGDEDLNVFIGIEEKNKDFLNEFEESDNILTTVFANGTGRETMINSLQGFVGGGAVIVMRRPIKIDELERFINCKHDIATCQVERTKFKEFMFNIWQKMLKTFLGLREYEGDSSVVYLSEDIATVTRESGNLSFSSRANRWKGVEQTTIEVQGQPVINEIDKKSLYKYISIAVVSIIIALGVTLGLCLTIPISIIAGLLIICLDVVCVAVAFLSTIIAIFNKRVGTKKVAEANSLENSKFDIKEV